jgi:hypothetical protein
VVVSRGQQVFRALTLTSNGGTITTGALGTTTQLKSVTISGSGSTVLGGSISSVGAVDLSASGRTTTLSVSSTISSSAGGAISLAAVNGTTSGGQSLTLNTAGSTVLAGLIGVGVPLASITTNAAGTLTIRAGTIQTTGAQTFNDPTTLDINSTFVSSGGGAITFGSTLNATALQSYSLDISNGAGAIVLTGAVGAATNGSLGAITIASNGTTTISSTVQAVSLTTDVLGTTRLNSNISTVGDQQFGDAVILDDHVGITTSANGLVRFASTVDSATGESNNLSVATGSGNITFTGAIGGSRGLGNISLTSTGTTTFRRPLLRQRSHKTPAPEQLRFKGEQSRLAVSNPMEITSQQTETLFLLQAPSDLMVHLHLTIIWRSSVQLLSVTRLQIASK